VSPDGRGARDGGTDRARTGGGRILVVGIGAPDRADDAVGPGVIGLVAEQLALRALGVHPPGRGRRHDRIAPAELLVLADPMRLVDELGDCALLVVVDAVVPAQAAAGAAADAAGSIVVLETGSAHAPLPAALEPTAAGTHGFGLAAALELARALDRLPPRVVVVGVVAEHFDAGTPMAAGVRAALPHAAGRVLGVLAEAAESLHPGDPPPWQPHPTGVHPPPDRDR
jgi:hydrogenase maturation protease